MKKTQLLITALCASALLLGACNSKPNKKKTSSSVTSSQPEKVLSSIAVTTAPSKTSYVDGESFDPAGMVVTASYSDGSTADVTGQCTFSPSVIVASTTSVTVSYEGKTTTVAVNILDWSAADLAVLETAAHGEKFPFPGEGSYTFKLDSYGGGEYAGGDSSAAKIDAYKARFDTSVWEVVNLNSYYGFMAEKSVQTDAGKRYVSVMCYGYVEGDEETEGGITTDGSGQFCIDVSDPYYYSWEDSYIGETIDYYFSFLASVGHATEYKVALPAVESFDHMGVYISDLAQYVEYASLAYSQGGRYTSPYQFQYENEIDIYCDQATYEQYAVALGGEESDYEFLRTSQGYSLYASKEGSLQLLVGYNAESSVMFLVPDQKSEESFPVSFVGEVVEKYVGASAPAVPAFAPTSTTVSYDFYFEDFDNCYIVDALAWDPATGYSTNAEKAEVSTYLAGFDTEVFEVGEETAGEGYSYWVVSAKDGSYQFAIYFVEETEEAWAYIEFEFFVSIPEIEGLPLEAIDTYWATYQFEVPAAHAFAVASEEASFQYLEHKDGSFTIYVNGATSDELATFLSGFASPWVVDDSYSSLGIYQVYAVAGAYAAVIEVEDSTDDAEDPYVSLTYYVGYAS